MPENKTLTEFNSNIATLERIDKMLRQCADLSVNQNLYEWYRALMVLRREAVVKMKREDGTEIQESKLTSGMRGNVQKMFKDLVQKSTMYKKYPDDMKIKDSFETALDDFEIYLRDYMDKKGMLLRDEMSDESIDDW